jgi:hypothetical protein
MRTVHTVNCTCRVRSMRRRPTPAHHLQSFVNCDFKVLSWYFELPSIILHNLRGLLALSHSFLTSSLWRTQHQATSDQATTEQISHFLNLQLKSHVFSNCVICFSSGCSRQQVLASQGANSHGAMHDPCFAIWICLFPFLTFTLSKYYPFNVHRRL